MEKTNQAEQNKKVRNTVGFVLTVVMIGLTIFVLYIQNENYQTLEVSSDLALNSNVKQSENYRHYVKQYTDTKSQLAETQSRLSKMTLELELVSKELETTKSMLADTQNLLAKTQEENRVLSGDPAAAARLSKIASEATNANKAVTKNLQDLQKKNTSYGNELVQLQNDLNNYQVNANNADEGRQIIKELKAKINAVKQKMSDLRREARLAKLAAQQERDRQLAVLGNNGYLIKDGQVYVPQEQASAPAEVDTETPAQPQAQAAVPEKKAVDIDVQFVQ